MFPTESNLDELDLQLLLAKVEITVASHNYLFAVDKTKVKKLHWHNSHHRCYNQVQITTTTTTTTTTPAPATEAGNETDTTVAPEARWI